MAKKYVDTDLLKSKLKDVATEFKTGNYYLDNSEQAVGYENALIDFEQIIDSLQQEQPSLPNLGEAAPTLWVAMKWLGEKHIVIIPEVETFYADGSVSSWEYHIWCDDNYEEGQNGFSSYEEACEAGIKFCLENLI